MIIDSHCHLDYSELYNDLENIVDRANRSDVKILLTISTTLNSFTKIKKIVSKFQNIYGTIGIHPHESKNFESINKNAIIKYKKESKKIIGVGETGLDFYYNHSDKNIQKKVFLEHIEAAVDLDIPLIVHSRSAEKDTLEILKSYMKNTKLKTIVHCFTGSKNFANKLIDIGCYISVSGIITFKNSVDLSKTILDIPIERLLVETDSPYLSPSPNRGKSNEPSYIIHTVKKLSEIKNIDIQTVRQKTTNNFTKLFKF